jgi:CHAT domain-containing protein
MSGKVFFVLLSFLFVFSINSFAAGDPPFKGMLSAYERADHLFNTANNSPAADSLCILDFKQVIAGLNHLNANRTRDSLLYQANYKLGILFEIYRNYTDATSAYREAMRYAMAPAEKFRMNVFAGAGYYNLNNFDSASYFLLRAEETGSLSGTFEDRIRLYNTLGVLYYDNGNYLQSKNYFTQALGQITAKNPADDFAYSLQLNMATCFNKLGLFKQALGIYRKIQHTKLFPDALYMNMGKAYAGLHQYDSALEALRNVKISAVPGVLNEMARISLESGKQDAAGEFLKQYQNDKKSLHTNVLDDAVNELYSGDLNIELGNPEIALIHLQRAMVIFCGNFSDSDLRKNPSSFIGTFAYYRLFEVLEKKASAWEKVYQKTSHPEDLKSAYDADQSAILLLSYIERSYEMDDAKILLKQKSGRLYSNALSTCLQLNKIYPEANYLEEGFLISEKNKASVISSQIRERNFFRGSENELTAEERNIRFNIARLNTKADDRIDTKELQKINIEKSGYETQLVNLRRKMEGDGRFYRLKYSDDFPTIPQLQNKMDRDQALISFYNEPDKIDVFVLTKSSLDHIQLDSGNAIRQKIQSWIQILETSESGRHMKTAALNQELFTQLTKPIIDLAGGKEQWIIVPDGLFFQLPIESLYENNKGKLIIEDHAVSYEFSARFIVEDDNYSREPVSNNTVLSFAPFSQRSLDLQSEGMGWMEKLPFSKGEIAGLTGMQFADQQGTKEAFLSNLNRFPIIHLATHAVTDLENPSASYIAFYPSTGLRSEDFLFLDEIYSLHMDSCRLMVISACETGRGELVHNEGVMSFARAFLYSGCPSTINTLWKADDRSTAEILKLFYTYLEAGDSKSRALQRAKLDFIRNNPTNRNPAYWSHIVLTGEPGQLFKKKQPWFWAVFAMS